MDSAGEKYKRLTRYHTASGIVTSSRESLWMGDDHLLLVRKAHFRESYRRFYFRDIQAIIIQKTTRRRNWNIVFGSILLAFLLAAGLVTLMSGKNMGVFFCLGFAALFLGIMLINWAKGPTCVCRVQTAVQTEVLAPLRRLRYARKIIGRLAPIIVNAQGGTVL